MFWRRYDGSMDELLPPIANRLLVVVAPGAAHMQMLATAAHLALNGPLRVVDAGNQFNVYPVAREIRRYSPAVQAALENIHLARGFTCYQVLSLLEQPPGPAPLPVLVLDLLSTFYDENVPLPESRRLLERALRLLQALARRAPVIVSARPPSKIVHARVPLLDALLEAAGDVWSHLPEEDETPAGLLPGGVRQPALWE